MEESARPLWEKSDKMGDGPGIERFFFVAFDGGGFAGATATDPERVTELRPILMRPVFSEPGARAFVNIDNLLDKTYMASAHEYGVRPNKPQTFMAGFSLDF